MTQYISRNSISNFNNNATTICWFQHEKRLNCQNYGNYIRHSICTLLLLLSTLRYFFGTRQCENSLYLYVKVPWTVCCLLGKMNFKWFVASNFCPINICKELCCMSVCQVDRVALLGDFQFRPTIANSLTPLLQFIDTVRLHTTIVFLRDFGVVTKSVFVAATNK